MSEKAPLSVVVITKNEEDNMDECLGSVHDWADEIVIVDDESTDRTIEIAKKYTDSIFHKKMENEGKHRNWAQEQARNDWVLVMDADEYLSEELKKEIASELKDTDCNLYSIPLRNYIGTYPVQYSGWYPAHKSRLFQKSSIHYEEVGVHPRLLTRDGQKKKTGFLSGDIIHKGYPDFEHFLGSSNRQTTLEAEKWITTGRKVTMGKAFWRAFDRFFRSYLRKKGYKDGFIGFMIGIFSSIYQVVSYAKYWEIKNDNKRISHKDQPSPEINYDGPTAPLTVLVMTKNEEDNISDCLRSVHGWADEIIVIDDESTDNTRTLAQEYATKVVSQKWVNEGVHRNWCIAQARNDWIMFLDADEMVTDELKHELVKSIKEGGYDSYSLPLKTFIGKTWVKHCGWYPANKVRVMNRKKQWFKEEKVHPTMAHCVPDKKCVCDIFHKGYPGFEHFLGSINRQTTAEAKKWIEEGRKVSLGKGLWRTTDRFFRVYFRKAGFKDGFIGFMVAYFASVYQIMSYAKYWQMKREGTYNEAGVS